MNKKKKRKVITALGHLGTVDHPVGSLVALVQGVYSLRYLPLLLDHGATRTAKRPPVVTACAAREVISLPNFGALPHSEDNIKW